MSELMKIIDSHTGGEPTRTIVSGGPDLGNGTMAERKARFSAQFDHIRTQLIGEPRGSAVMVGALVCEPVDPNHTAGVIFFNNAGFLGMCGHGTIGLMATLYHLGQIELGIHTIETPVGNVEVEMLSPTKVKVTNVPSYRYRQNVTVDVPEIGQVTGDIAWGGNWFYLINDHGQALTLDNAENLTKYTQAISEALAQQGIVGEDGGAVDHIELFGAPTDATIADSQNFVLCPGMQYDRSPCGTGTSAKLACLYQDGKLKQGQIWRQQSITASVFEGSVAVNDDVITPSISGEAFITMESAIIIDDDDPLVNGF